jgi:hypothetical protein
VHHLIPLLTQLLHALFLAAALPRQVVGFTHGYHAMTVMASGAKLARGRRIAQVQGVRLALHSPAAQPDGGRAKLFMQLDGEPWEQQVPAGSSQERVVVSGCC